MVLKHWVAHCTVSAFDGVSNITARPTITTDAKNEREAVIKIRKELVKRYEGYGCKSVTVSFAILKEVGDTDA